MQDAGVAWRLCEGGHGIRCKKRAFDQLDWNDGLDAQHRAATTDSRLPSGVKRKLRPPLPALD